ncbi:MAG: hypothetical protein HY553_23350 [Elusimicrobia bacterium]|nr:hypothetical protein [Elusimicrobiota bacterium]
MKATIEFPDDLYRKVKARSALEGRSVREVALDLFRRWLVGESRSQAQLHAELMKFAGSVDSGITDLATNPKHMEDFGRDSMGHR